MYGICEDSVYRMLSTFASVLSAKIKFTKSKENQLDAQV